MIRVQRVFRLNGTCFLNYVRTRNEPSLINVLIMKKLTRQALKVPNLTTQFNSHEFEWQCFVKLQIALIRRFLARIASNWNWYDIPDIFNAFLSILTIYRQRDLRLLKRNQGNLLGSREILETGLLIWEIDKVQIRSNLNTC